MFSFAMVGVMAEGKRAQNRRRNEAEIIEAAERVLASEGAHALTLRGVAAEVGLVPSAIYRYYPGIEALLTALIIRAYNDIGVAAREAERASVGESPRTRSLVVCRAIRDWAIEQPRRYALIYGSPVPGYVAPQETAAHASRATDVLFDVLREAEVPLPEAEEVGIGADFAGRTGVMPELLPDALDLFTTLIGAINLELFGHWAGVLDDPATFFDAVIERRLDALLG